MTRPTYTVDEIAARLVTALGADTALALAHAIIATADARPEPDLFVVVGACVYDAELDELI